MHTSIHPEAPVISSGKIEINAPVSRVWVVLTSISDWAQWQTDISHPRLIGELRPGASFTWKTGGVGIRSTLHTVNPYCEFGWTGKTFGMFAIHNWVLTGEGSVTTVEVEESMEGILAMLFRKSFQQNLESGMTRWLQLLKQESERRA